MTNTPDLETLLGISQPQYVRTVSARIVEASPDVAVCALTDGRTGRLPVTEFYPNRPWTVGSTYQLAATDDHPIRLSATTDQLPALLLDGLVPEIRNGQVRVMAVARHVGVRAKIAVASTDASIDPVGACLGRAANRIKALSTLMQGERVDVVAYHSDPDRFLLNALAVSPVSTSIAEDGVVTVVVPRHQITAARGGGNLNVVLAARLCGRRVQVQGA